MKIDILCNDGSPLGVCSHDIYGIHERIGVGGAELALLTMCEAWHDRGDDVTLYNNPRFVGGSSFRQKPIVDFIPFQARDILIIFRSPNDRILGGASGLKVWWSCDQYTIGSFQTFRSYVKRVVTISKFHTDYFRKHYGIQRAITIDLPVRMDDFDKDIEKVDNRLIFCSVPDRGLLHLRQAWPEIKRDVPDASLVITSDYRLWGLATAKNEDYIRSFFGQEDVSFLGALPREKYIEEQLKADILAYPCTYDELFCISCAESQVAGAFPITSDIGALSTTNMGRWIEGNPTDVSWMEQFKKEIVDLLINREWLKAEQQTVMIEAKKRFSVERILKEWDEKVFNK